MTPSGRRVLVVEDEALVADMLEAMVQENGMIVVSTASPVAPPKSMANAKSIDAAILDVNLRGERIDPVAEALRSRGVPVILATGYGDGAADAAPGATVLTKPYTADQLARATRILRNRVALVASLRTPSVVGV